MSSRSVGKEILKVTALAGVLALASLVVMAAILPAMAQDTGLTLVNADREFVERKKEGHFIARPVFSRELDELYYAIRDADTGDWITLMYRVQGGEKKLNDGWEYSWEYPALSGQPDLDPDKSLPAGDRSPRRRPGRPLRLPRHHPHIRAQQDLGQDPPSPGPRKVGQGLRPLGHRGRAWGPVRRARAGHQDGPGQLRGRRLMGDILTGTPPELTYGHPAVREAWMVVWGVTSGALIVILGWMGLSLIMQHHLGQASAGWREMVPRLVLGLVAAATSYWWCALVIDVAHAVSKYIAVALSVNPGDLLRAPLETFSGQ